MKINSNLNVGRLGRPEGSRPKKVELQAVKAKPNFAQSAALNRALHESPDVRADLVAKAKQAVADPSYPSSETIRKIASLLADSIASQDR